MKNRMKVIIGISFLAVILMALGLTKILQWTPDSVHEATNNLKEPNQIPSKEKTSQTNEENETQTPIGSNSSQVTNITMVAPLKDRSWRKPSKVFDGYFSMVNKALITDEEGRVLKSILMNEKYIDRARTALLTFNRDRYDWNQERARLESLAFISDVLVNVKNDIDHQQKLIDVLVEVYESPIDFSWNEDLVKSLIGDKIEVGYLIKTHAPARWRDIMKKKDTDNLQRQLVASVLAWRVSPLETATRRQVDL